MATYTAEDLAERIATDLGRGDPPFTAPDVAEIVVADLGREIIE